MTLGIPIGDWTPPSDGHGGSHGVGGGSHGVGGGSHGVGGGSDGLGDGDGAGMV